MCIWYGRVNEMEYKIIIFFIKVKHLISKLKKCKNIYITKNVMNEIWMLEHKENN